jgi:hypothetical protein
MKNLIKTLFVTMIILAGFYEFYGLSQLIHPVAKSSIPADGDNTIRNSLTFLGCPKNKITAISNGIKIASEKTGISRLLISSLLFTESNFRYEAVSKKGYVGIAQTPYASKVYPEVDILHGMMILKDKLRIADGNMITALSLYKGGRNSEALRQAQYVVKVYNNLIRRAEGVV